MKPSQPQNPGLTTLECPCGWSRKVGPDVNAEEAARYHRIQVHNDPAAVRANPKY